MTRISRVLGAFALALTAGACLSSEPEFSQLERIPAAARQATEQAQAAGGEGEGEGEQPAEGGPVLTFVAVDIAWEEAPAEAPAGNLTVELVNEGAAIHNVVIEGVDGDAPIAEAPGGETATGNVALEAGDYTFYCSIPGHRAQMEGTLTVTG